MTPERQAELKFTLNENGRMVAIFRDSAAKLCLIEEDHEGDTAYLLLGREKYPACLNRKQAAALARALASFAATGRLCTETTTGAGKQSEGSHSYRIGKYEVIAMADNRWHLFLDGQEAARDYRRLTDARRAIKNEGQVPDRRKRN